MKKIIFALLFIIIAVSTVFMGATPDSAVEEPGVVIKKDTSPIRKRDPIDLLPDSVKEGLLDRIREVNEANEDTPFEMEWKD